MCAALGLVFLFVCLKTQHLNLMLSFNANACHGQAVLTERRYGERGALRMPSGTDGQLSTIDRALHTGGEKARVKKKNTTCLERMLLPFGDQNKGQSSKSSLD